MLQIHLNHGRTPDKSSTGSYAYIVKLSCKGIDELKHYYESRPVTILSNTKGLQAVCHNKEQIIQAVFYNSQAILRAGDMELRVNVPAIVMLNKSQPGKLSICISDPCQNSNLKELIIKVNKNLSGVGTKLVNDGSIITIKLPEDPYCGKNVSRTFYMEEVRK